MPQRRGVDSPLVFRLPIDVDQTGGARAGSKIMLFENRLHSFIRQMLERETRLHAEKGAWCCMARISNIGIVASGSIKKLCSNWNGFSRQQDLCVKSLSVVDAVRFGP